MAIILDAVAGSLTANSYATVAEADAYMASRLYHDVWDDADVADKINALITATRLLDEKAVWVGWPMNWQQILGWPRSGVINRNGAMVAQGLIPIAIRNATSELALHLLTLGAMPNTPSDIPRGLRSLKVDTIDIQFEPTLTDHPDRPIDVIPSSVWSIISFLVETRSSNGVNVPLYRA